MSSFFSLLNFLKKVFGVKRLYKKRTVSTKNTRAVVNDYLVKKRNAYHLVVELIERVNKIYGFEYGTIAIRNQKTRWGSCSSQGNLNFNYRIVDLPPKLAEYIVVHELCHLKEMNHGPSFWKLVEQGMPDYRQVRSDLKNCGVRLG